MLDAGYGMKWYEVTDYMTGPIVALAQTWVTMNKDTFNELPSGPATAALGRGQVAGRENLKRSIEGTEKNIQLNVDAGLELRDWPDEVKPVLKETSINIILPN